MIFDKDARRKKDNEEEEQRQGYVRFVVSLILHPKELDYNWSDCDRSVLLRFFSDLEVEMCL